MTEPAPRPHGPARQALTDSGPHQRAPLPRPRPVTPPEPDQSALWAGPPTLQSGAVFPGREPCSWESWELDDGPWTIDHSHVCRPSFVVRRLVVRRLSSVV